MRSAFVCIALFGGVLSLYGLDTPTKNIEDDSGLRIALKDSWFLESPDKVLSQKKLSRTLVGGSKIEVRAEAGQGEFAVIIARERNKQYPGWAQGSWILTRRRDTGAAIRIRTFLRSDPNVYVQFRPMQSDKSLMDVVVYDGFLVRSMPVPFSFDRLMTIPVEEVFSSLGEKFPRKYFDPEPGLYKDNRAFVQSVRQRIGGLNFRDDGAIDENGDYVFIETLKKQDGQTTTQAAGANQAAAMAAAMTANRQTTASEGPVGLNCSGFAKWVIDGLLRPVTGKRLPITPLKAAFGDRGSRFTAAYDATRDPFFGLDWIRNLAAAAGTTLIAADFGKQGEFEVKNWPFSLVTLRTKKTSSVESFPGFLTDAGFNLEGIHPLLYTLAIEEPHRIYLAAVSNVNVQGTPQLRQYFHIAVLVPYFNEQGNFQVTLFESAEETSFARFKTRYPADTFVNLVRIPLSNQFDP
jgi:hypothetical protein